MAGSRKYFSYTTDLGDEFALNADESNGEAVALPDLAGTATAYTLPRNVKPRFATYRSADGLLTRKAYCSPDFTSAPATIIDGVTGSTLNLVATKAEERTNPIPVDTGLIDGDAS